MKTQLLGLLLCALLALPTLAGCSARAQSDRILGAEVVPPVFRAVAAEVEAASNIPVLLPTSIPEVVLREPAPGQDEPFYPSIARADRGGYDINLDAIDQCYGAGYCNFGVLGAIRLTADTPTVDEEYSFYLDPTYQPMMRSEEPITTVTLSGGITGTFIPWVCGANCNAAKVFWEEQGIRYFVGIRSGRMRDVVAIANAMIENQPASGVPDSTNPQPGAVTEDTK
ncbi:MAG: hypothetical protein WBG32_09420 [Nodosilinea sp.]